jgi:NAD(P)-dependent dehydrogenase (short-subunit alcohol dehydrogenase family)
MDTSKTILITGATSGIGRHAALHLTGSGHHVIATGRNEAKLAELAGEAAGTHLTIVRLDVTDQDSIAAAREQVDRITGGSGVDVLINNAGFGVTGPLAEIDDGDLRRQFDTNVFGLMAVTRAFLPQMQQRRSGRILNVSSVGGRMSFPFMGAYTATKHALEAMSDALRYELSPFGIDVVLIEPGVINTGFGDRAMETIGKYGRRPDSPYAPVYARADELQKLTESIGVDPIVISRVIDRAIRARRPRARYVAPFRSYLGLAVGSLLPTRVTDWAIRRLAGLTPRHFLADTSAQAQLTSPRA